MKRIKLALWCMIISMVVGCGRNTTVDKDITVYYGQNKYYIPALIIDTKSKLNEKEAREAITGFQKEKAAPETNIKTLLRWKNKPYALIYSGSEDNKKEHQFKFYEFEKIENEFKELIKDFESVKASTTLQKHELYGYYFGFGASVYFGYVNRLEIISRNTSGEYFLSSFLNGNIVLSEHLLKKEGKFDLEYEHLNHDESPPQLIRTKKILYETEDKDIAVKDIYYVPEESEKYDYFFFRIDK